MTGKVSGVVPITAVASLGLSLAVGALALTWKGWRWATGGAAQKTFILVAGSAVLCFTAGWIFKAPAGWVGAAFLAVTTVLGFVVGIYGHFKASS